MSTFPGPQDPFDTAEAEPRTSIVAVVSIICSLICLIPVLTGMLGAFLGVIALFLIGGSSGRLKGRGFAFGGVVLGLLTSMLWIGFLLGGVRLLGGTINAATATFRAIDEGDLTKARSTLTPTLDQSLSDEQLHAFGQLVLDDLGSFVGGPKSLLEYISGVRGAGMSGFGIFAQDGKRPVALEYENGTMLAFMKADASGLTGSSHVILDIGYERPNGSVVWLGKMELEAPDNAPQEAGKAGEPDDPSESNEAGGEGGG